MNRIKEIKENLKYIREHMLNPEILGDKTIMMAHTASAIMLTLLEERGFDKVDFMESLNEIWIDLESESGGYGEQGEWD